MATSDSLATAQDVKRCHLCPNKHIKSTADTVCNTCHVNLCRDCVGHHMMSNPTIRHDVVTFQFKKLEIIPPQCEIHEQQKCETFCEQCDSPICMKCLLVSGPHEKHDVSHISEIHSFKKQLIESDTQELEKNIVPSFESILSEIEEMLSNVLQKHSERQQTITEFGKRCHTLVDIVINRYVSDSKKMEKQDGDSIKTLKSEFDKLQSSIQSTIKENNSILASNDFSKFTGYASRNEELRNIPSRFELTLPPLDLKELTEQALTKFIGVIPPSIKTNIPGQVLQVTHPVSNVSKPNKKLSGKPEVFAALKTDDKNISKVCCIPNTDQFYVRIDNNIIRRMNTEGTLLEEIIAKSGHVPYDLTVTREGDLVCYYWKDGNVTIEKNGKTECQIRLQGYFGFAFCSTSTDDLLVTMSSNDLLSAKVVRYSGSTVTQEIQNSDTGERLYVYPTSITENKNHDIVVSEYNTVVVVDNDGKFRFRYNGSRQSNNSFTLGGVTTDSMCHILIADSSNHVIHIIDENGQFLQYIDNCNLHRPHCLSTDSNDLLFVTESQSSIVKQIKYCE